MELAFLISKSRWREGFATEAAQGIIQYARDQLRLSRLISLVVPCNVPSERVATKVGMVFERDYTDPFGPCRIYGRSLDAQC